MLESAPLPVLAALAFFILVTPLVVLHEFGHFLVARLFGVKVDRFSIGFGRAILSWKRPNGMEWRLGWIPLGGYVKFAGDANAASAVPDSEDLADLKREIAAAEGPGAYKRYFHFKPIWQRALIVFAGPAMNFVLAVALYAVLFSAVGVRFAPPLVQKVIPGSPAAAAGFQPQDLIVRIGHDQIKSADEAVQDISLRSGTPTTFVVQRSGREIEITATPRRTHTTGGGLQPSEYGRIGLQLGGQPVGGRLPIDQGIAEGARQSWRLLDLTVTYVGRIVTGKESGDAIGGPLGTAAVSGTVVKQAVAAAPGKPEIQLLYAGVELLQLAAILSVSVGFLNLLPIPILDGGHLLFYAYEAVARKPLGARVQEAGFRIGLALLAGLMLFATWNDLQKLSVFKNLGGLLS